MRQLLMNSGGVVVARVPRPVVDRGSVLVRVQYSLISVGTEIAPLRPSAASAPDATAIERGAEYAALARHYLKASLRDPRKAMERMKSIARQQVKRVLPARSAPVSSTVSVGDLTWTTASPSASVTIADEVMTLVTDETAAGYQIMSQAVGVPDGQVPVVRLQGRVDQGVIAVGLLNDARDKWLGTRTYPAGPFKDTIIFDPGGASSVTLVVATAGAPGASRVTLNSVDVGMAPPSIGGLPLSELETQGWTIGYSAAGEVLAVGEGVTDLAPGDLVACAGAGQANHADFIVVKRNLVCRLPPGGPRRSWASAWRSSASASSARSRRSCSELPAARSSATISIRRVWSGRGRSAWHTARVRRTSSRRWSAT